MSHNNFIHSFLYTQCQQPAVTSDMSHNNFIHSAYIILKCSSQLLTLNNSTISLIFVETQTTIISPASHRICDWFASW